MFGDRACGPKYAVELDRSIDGPGAIASTTPERVRNLSILEQMLACGTVHGTKSQT